MRTNYRKCLATGHLGRCLEDTDLIPNIELCPRNSICHYKISKGMETCLKEDTEECKAFAYWDKFKTKGYVG